MNARIIESYSALVNRKDIDAVLVLSEGWAGCLPILAAAEAGKAVYWASDMNWDVDTRNHIRNVVERSGIAFMIEFPNRFAAASIRLKELMATRLGPPRLIFCHKRIPFSAVEGKGKPSGAGCSRGHGTDNLYFEMAQLVDWCNFIAGGEPSSVMSIGHERRPELADEQNTDADYRLVSLDFSHFDGDRKQPGPLAQLSVGAYYPQGWEEALSYRPLPAMQVCCERGIAYLDLPSSLVWFDDSGRHQERLDDEKPAIHHALMHFFRAVTSLVRQSDDIRQSYLVMEILEAAKKSRRSAHTVHIE